jgi:regulator of sigma E protease
MNFVFAFVAYTVLAGFGALDLEGIATTEVDQIHAADLPAVAAPLASLVRGDRITTVNGDSVLSWSELEERLLTAPAPVTLGVAGRSPITIPFAPGDTTARIALLRALHYYLPADVAEVLPGTPGARAGIKPGDRILKVDADTVRSWEEFAGMVQRRPGQDVVLTLERDGQTVTIHVVPEKKVERDPVTNQQQTLGRVGVLAAHPMIKAGGVFGAIRLGWRETTNKVGVILTFLKRPRAQELGGPLTIGQVSGEAARGGMLSFVSFMAFLSVNLAVLNLLPIPILDGGQVVFLVAELVRRRPLSLELRARLTQIGFVVLVSIMLIALRNDVLRVFPHVFAR